MTTYFKIENNINRAKSVLSCIQDQFTDEEKDKLNDEIIFFSLESVRREIDDIAEKSLAMRDKERQQEKQIEALKVIALTQLTPRKLDLFLDFAALSDDNMAKVWEFAEKEILPKYA